MITNPSRERSDSVVECLTRDRGVNFFLSSNLQCLIDVSEKILDENQILHNFYE